MYGKQILSKLVLYSRLGVQHALHIVQSSVLSMCNFAQNLGDSSKQRIRGIDMDCGPLMMNFIEVHEMKGKLTISMHVYMNKFGAIDKTYNFDLINVC